MNSITALLVDDEQLPRSLLRAKLTRHFPDLQIIAEASDAEEAYRWITEECPDLVFLDISMPRENGFDLLRRLPNLDFEVIFVTSFDEYALQAIEFCAIGYVVKPVETDALIRAVKNGIKRIVEKSGINYTQELLENFSRAPENKRIALPTNDGLEFMATKDVIRCEGYQKYTKIYLTDGRCVVSSSNIGKFVDKLVPCGFYSIHKSHLVNVDLIKAYTKEGDVLMEDGSTAPVSRRKKTEFLEHLKKIKG